ncbi:uncharacterized protein zgc:174888 [Nothobranchius furzeri]|uniref:LOC107379555-like protein n=2 Tax=Nothobranchius TaxID=28779 RepID=A0A1A8UYG9_NOTFU|nr:putative LOC107379555-like protein [Nothobranchius furzeri]
MSLQVLLLLLLLIVQCGGCDFDRKGVENIKATIESNPTGFRTVFPKDYYVVHHYTKSMLCETDPCCVFPAAVVLLDSWNELLGNLWGEHVNRSLILELKLTLDKIIDKNKNIERFQEETDLSQFPTSSSSPEELLKLTSQLFERWLQVGCSSYTETCFPPTLPPPVVKKDYRPSRARLLTTRAINNQHEGQPDKMTDYKPLSSSGPVTVSYSAFVWSSLLFGLYW